MRFHWQYKVEVVQIIFYANVSLFRYLQADLAKKRKKMAFGESKSPLDLQENNF